MVVWCSAAAALFSNSFFVIVNVPRNVLLESVEDVVAADLVEA